MVEDFGPTPSELQPSAIAYSTAPAMVIPTAVSLPSLKSTRNRDHHPAYPHRQQQQEDTPGSTLRQLPILRSCTFVMLRVLLFPKTVFVKGVAVGRGCLGKVGVLHTPRHRYRQQLHVVHSHRDTNDPYHNSHQPYHFRSHQQPSASPQVYFDSGWSSRRSRSASDLTSSSRHHHRRRRSQSPPRYGRHYPRQSTYSNSNSNNVNRKRPLRNYYSDFLNSYNVQVATICLCLTGEAFAQAVMCPFLYYMVRDFHVGADKWIGYYAGLLLTGFWGANLATTLFWGYLSDKYGRKAIMLFGLFVTSLSTVYLGLSTCYHDAMWALVIQGACTGLVPVSKCSIGELANRQQRHHNAEIALTQQRQRLLRRQREQRRRQQSAEWKHELDEKTMSSVYKAESENGQSKAATANAHYDFASKGYSALVIALALGAALGPLAGGVLTKKMIPGFEAFPYFAPCLLASAVGLFITGVVGLVLNETHPKWAKTSELEKTLENLSRFENTEEEIDEDVGRGRPGYGNSRHYEAVQAATNDADLMTVDSESGDQDVVASLSVGGTTTMLDTRPRLRQTAGAGTITPPTVVCTCHPHKPAEPVPQQLAYYRSSSSSNSNPHPQPPSPSKLSPATELYLTLAIYTLLVLTSILGSEFVMLYTQSPTFRGGLEFSAQTLGQILTLRGILKLGFTLCGYPWVVKRIGLLKCLRLGVVAIGVFSVVGLGWFVPSTIFAQQESTRNRALVNSSMDLIGAAGEGALTPGGEEGNLPAGGGGGGGSEKTPVGMGVILLCLSLISMGDVLGYVSVLVLFGKSADRMKGVASAALTAGAGRTGSNAPIDSASSLENQAGINNNNNHNNAGAGSGATGPGAQQGGSGVLWSVAQVSGNVMRLTGPVLAGLLWSLVETSRALSTSTITDLHHVSPSSGSSSSSASSKENQQLIMYPDSRLSQSASLTNNNNNNNNNSKEPTLFGKAWAMSTSWQYNNPTTTNSIFFGSTSVFYLIGVICFINFIACQYLISSSSSSVEPSLISGYSSSLERSRSRSMTGTRSRTQSGASSSGAGAGEFPSVPLSRDEQEIRHLEQRQQQGVVMMMGMEQGHEEERSYSIGLHPQPQHHSGAGVMAPFCALHRPPTMQTV